MQVSDKLLVSYSLSDLIDTKVHFLYNFPTLIEDILFLFELIPCEFIHSFYAAPTIIHFFFELFDPWGNFPHDAICPGLDIFLHLFKLLPKLAYLESKFLRI